MLDHRTKPNFTKIEDFLVLLGAFITLYSACWLVPYLFTDDYANLAASYRGNLQESLDLVKAGGRSIYAAFLWMGFSSVDSFSSLRILRFISIVGVAVTAWCISLSLRAAGWCRRSSLLTAFLIGTLPAFEVYAAWAVAYIFPFAAAITMGAVRCMDFKPHTHWRKKLLFLTIAILIFVLSLNIYQPAAMFFWVFAAIRIFVANKNDYASQIKKFLSYLVVFGCSLLISFLILKGTEGVISEKSSRAVLVTNLHDGLGKIKWFILQPLADSANFVNIHVSYWISLLVLGVILIGSFYYLEGTMRRKLTQLGMGLGMVVLSYTPNLLVTSSLASYRTQVALSALVLLFFLLAMEGLSRRISNQAQRDRLQRLFAIVLLSLFSVGAMYNVIVGFVVPQYTELASLRIQLQPEQLATTSAIYYVAPDLDHSTSSLSPIRRYDEFGIPSSMASWAQKNTIYMMLHELRPQYENLPVVVVKRKDEIPHDAGILVVDTSSLWSLKTFFYH